MRNFLVLHGPNLNLLGSREPEHYGLATLDQINLNLEQIAHADENSLTTFQSNSEGDIVDVIHRAADQNIDFIIINPAAFTHTSVAIRDALSAVRIPFIEIHLSNVYAREPFRKHSYFADKAVAVIAGLGSLGYELAYLGGKAFLSNIQD